MTHVIPKKITAEELSAMLQGTEEELERKGFE